MSERTIDILCMGRAAVDLYSQQIGAPLEEAATLAKYVGGCPANIAIGTARLGLQSGMLTGVGDEAMGRYVRDTLAEEGVDVGAVVTKPDNLTGLVLLGVNPPDHFPLIFYRQDCADMALSEDDFSLETFQRSRALLITGTHCSNKRIFSVTQRAVALACEAGTEVIVDIDYRPVLWGAVGHGGGEERDIGHAAVARRMSLLLPHCSVVVGTEEELRVAAGEETVSSALESIRNQTSAIIVQKRGEQGCVCYSGEASAPITGEAFAVDVLNVLGAGDAFMSGFLRGYLDGMGLEDCCRLANANGALVVTRHGCAPAMPYWSELQHFMGQPSDISGTACLHRMLGRQAPKGRTHILAIDHRLFFETRENSQVSNFKKGVFQALMQVKERHPDHAFGIIADHQYGSEILRDAGDCTDMAVFQCVEASGSPNWQFLGGREAAAILASWPRRQAVKYLCPVPQDGEIAQMIHQLKCLQEACDMTGHELLVELIGQNMSVIASAMERCYRNGISPCWWKLPPHDEPEAWDRIIKVIGEYDPHCYGCLLLGQGVPLDALSDSVHSLMDAYPIIKGFAVGRSVWGETADRYFSGQMTDDQLVQEVAERFESMVVSVAGPAMV